MPCPRAEPLFSSAKTADLSEWGATAGLVSGEVKYSLLPLLGAYCPTAIFTTYSEALADLVVSGLSSVTHTDVRAEFSNLVVSVYNA